MACVFDKCCGCIELKTGCFIIGYLHLIGQIIAALGLLIVFAIGGALVSNDNDNVKVGGAFIIVACGIFLFFLIIGTAFTITLLVGLHKDRRGHILAYLIFTGIFYGITVILFFAAVFTVRPIPVKELFEALFSLLLNLYFLLVIRSQYVKLGDYSSGAVYNAPKV